MREEMSATSHFTPSSRPCDVPGFEAAKLVAESQLKQYPPPRCKQNMLKCTLQVAINLQKCDAHSLNMQDLLMLLKDELLPLNLYTPAVQKILLYSNLNWVFPTNVAVWSAPTARNHESQQPSLVLNSSTDLPQPAEISSMSKGSTWHPEDLACWQRSARLHLPSALPAKVFPQCGKLLPKEETSAFPIIFLHLESSSDRKSAKTTTSTGLRPRGEFLAAVLWRIPVISNL